MYKNPLNNGDISDYNSLKKQQDNGSKVKKYQSVKLQTKPTELQKYYQYLTYQQPILDELNYVAEKMRTEDIKKKTDEYDFIEGLKIKKEGLMKETSKKEEDKGMEDLFDKSSTIKNDDMTPIINTDVELEYPTEPQPEPITISNTPEKQALMSDLFGEEDNVLNEIFSTIENVPIKNEIFELSKTTKEKKNKKIKLSEELIAPVDKEVEKVDKEAKKADREAKKAKKEAKILQALAQGKPLPVSKAAKAATRKIGGKKK